MMVLQRNSVVMTEWNSIPEVGIESVGVPGGKGKSNGRILTRCCWFRQTDHRIYTF